MSFRRYAEYKSSGVNWVGAIPTHWEVRRLKTGFMLQTEKTGSRTNPVALENVESWTGRLIPTESEFEGEGVSFDPGDILFGKLRPYLAKAYLAESHGEAVGDFHVLRPSQRLHGRYAQYQILNRAFIDVVDGHTFGAKMPRVDWATLGNMPFAMPPIREQIAIADFLDRETTKIDALIAAQERLIVLLAEKRQATITHAVTQGLNPNAPMKDSGVGWLGHVPAHWSVEPLANRYNVQLGKMLDTAKITGKHLRPYLRVLDVQWGKINVEDLPLMDFDAEAQQRFRLLPGDVLVNEGGSYPGRSAIWRGEIEECFYQKALHRLRATGGGTDSSEFLFYVLFWASNTGVFVAGGNETTIEHLPAERLRRYRFAFPPLTEQTQIAAFLCAETERLAALERAADSAISLLKERRSSLIAAAVTGQIDVRSGIERADNDELALAA